MITSLNELNQQKYIQLFTKAYKELVEKGKISAEAQAYYDQYGRFTSLEEYFSYIAD